MVNDGISIAMARTSNALLVSNIGFGTSGVADQRAREWTINLSYTSDTLDRSHLGRVFSAERRGVCPQRWIPSEQFRVSSVEL